MDDNSIQRMMATTIRVPDHVVYRQFEAETLLLNLETGQYHGLNETGGRILELLKETDGRLQPATERLAEEYGVDSEEIEGDLVSFCAALHERGLVELHPGDDSG